MNKSILAVAMLMVACFAGFAVVGEDTDAAVMPYEVSFDDSAFEISNEKLGNVLAYEDGAITGTISKVAGNDPVWTTLGYNQTYTHIMIFTLSGIPQATYVTWVPTEGVGYKEIKVDDGELTMVVPFNDANAVPEKFMYWVSAASLLVDGTGIRALDTQICPNNTIPAIYPCYTIGYDLELLGEAIDVKYKVGDLTYVYTTIAGQDYQLVTLDNLRAIAPEGYEFDAWVDAKGNRYLAGSTLKLTEATTFTAQFKEIPVQEVFKVEFVVDGIVSQTCMSDNVVIPTNPAKEGFKFLNWAVDGVFANPANYAYTEDVQFVAQWEAYVYTVTFMAGGEIVGTPQTVKHGDLILAPALPAGYESWNFDFAQPIKSNTIIVAVEAPEPEPTGADNPMTLTVYILAAFIIIGLIACFVYLLKEGKLVIGRGSKVVKVEAPAEEEPKQ
ncbi:MAG: InlB B-repeat-containing protein [Candidatus Methanomethylophilaceae archaeon]|nr:InlB B-repeat-containing protein [Candidatus Methanomethylophilaceae archaeon]